MSTKYQSIPGAKTVVLIRIGLIGIGESKVFHLLLTPCQAEIKIEVATVLWGISSVFIKFWSYFWMFRKKCT